MNKGRVSTEVKVSRPKPGQEASCIYANLRGVQCVYKAAWVWFGDTIGLTQPYQVWAGHSLSQ